MNPSKRLYLVTCLLIFSLTVSAMPQSKSAQAGKGRARATRTSKTRARNERPKPPCRSGDFIVKVDPNATGSFNVPICIAPHSPVVIELPANDPFYAHHPGDERFVTIDPRSKTTDPLVIRPGDGFFIEPGRVRPTATVSVQMTSGLVGSFPIYAIEDVSLNNNHVIISYDRDGVIAARRRLNLRADLVPADILASIVNNTPALVQASTPQPQQQPVPQSAPRFVPRTSALSQSGGHPPQSRAVADSDTRPPVVRAQTFAASDVKVSASLPTINLEGRPAASRPSSRKEVSSPWPAPITSDPPAVSAAPLASSADESGELERVTREELTRVSGANKSLRFGSPLHGLSLAVSRSRFVMAGYRIEVVAVRNTLKEPLRLIPGQPEVYVETMHDGRPISAPRLAARFTVSTLAEGEMLAPGGTYYFAFAFDEPILGVNDFLRVAVSQTNAADEPVSANLITAAR